MRRTLSVVLNIVAFYNVRAIIKLSAIRRIAGNKLKRYLNTNSAITTPLNQGIFPLLKKYLFIFQYSALIKSALYLTKPVSLFFIFEHYKPINKNCHETDAFNRPYHCYLLQC
jgi:hypothetical protein